MARGWHSYQILSIECPFPTFFLACALCLKKNQNAPRPSEHLPAKRLGGIKGCFVPFFLSFVLFTCSRWSFVDVPFIFSCPADHVLLPDWQPPILLGMVEARSVNVKNTITTTTHTCVLLYSGTARCPGDISIRLGRTDASRQNSTTTNARSMSYRDTGSCCTKRFAEFNGNCESYRSLEQLVASLCAAHEGKSASGTYHPKTEGYTPEDTCTDHQVCCIVGGALGVE